MAKKEDVEKLVMETGWLTNTLTHGGKKHVSQPHVLESLLIENSLPDGEQGSRRGSRRGSGEHKAHAHAPQTKGAHVELISVRGEPSPAFTNLAHKKEKEESPRREPVAVAAAAAARPRTPPAEHAEPVPGHIPTNEDHHEHEPHHHHGAENV